MANNIIKYHKVSKVTSVQRQLITFGIPLVFIISMILITKSPIFDLNPDKLSLAITMDLLITIPLIYFLLIRKTTIPKTTIVPFLILGVVVGTFILPKENQQLLSLFKFWVLPLIELTIFSYVIYSVRKAVLKFKKNKQSTSDFFIILKETCQEILPKKVVMAVVTEIAVFYYGFIYWRKRTPEKNEFTYHKKSGTISLLIALIFIIGIETYVIHVLLMKWNAIVAMVFSLLSVYSGIQILGFLKSLLKRPYLIEDGKLKLYYGILSEAIIELNEIESIEMSNKAIEFNNENRKLSPLGALESHNIMINLKNENELTSLYGIKRKYKKLAFFVDDKVGFINLIETVIINPKI